MLGLLTSLVPSILKSPFAVFNNLHFYLLTIYMNLKKIFLFETSSSSSSAALQGTLASKQQSAITNMVSVAHLSSANRSSNATSSEPKPKPSSTTTATKSEPNKSNKKRHFDDDSVSFGSSYDSAKQYQQQASIAANQVANTSLFSQLPYFRWRPTSEAELADVESSILAHIKRPFKTFFVGIGDFFSTKDNKINTLELLTDREMHQLKHQQANGSTENLAASSDLSSSGHDVKVPLVLVHGFAAGIGFWILNYDVLAANKEGRKVYAFDILGFGRSSRPNFNLKENVEDQFVDSIEQWRKKMALDRMILLGHSFGGYLSANYALRHPERVAHLVLADPWGVSNQNQIETNNRVRMQLPLYVRTLTSIFQRFNPLAVLRFTGPYGPRLVHTFRTDLKEKFSPALQDESEKVLDYIYHCNAQNATGESAFKALTLPYGWARNPIIHRLLDIDESIPISFIYGSRSWIDRSPGEFVRDRRPVGKVGYHILNGAGHHVYADKYDEFNEIVLDICSRVED